MTNVLQKQPEPAVKSIPFIDLNAQQQRIRPQIDAAIQRVLDHGKYIMGPEVFELEEKLSDFCGAKHSITCSSGTDALLMTLMAKGIGPGDAVFVPSFTFTATPEAVALLGATPVFVDVDLDTFNIDSHSFEQAISVAQAQQLTPRALIAVDLYGQPADYQSLELVAERHGIWILADAAQSFGASLHNKKVGQLAHVTATSFFPAKPLGCYGDGGAVFTDDDELANTLRSIRVHGKGQHKYDNVRVGLNARLDTMQAAILLQKLEIFPDELIARQQVADAYNKVLKPVIFAPQLIPGATSAWAQYTLRLPKAINRDALMADLKTAGIPSVVYYARPLHLQCAYQHYPRPQLSNSETLAHEVLSLPMSAYVQDPESIASTFLNCIEKDISHEQLSSSVA